MRAALRANIDQGICDATAEVVLAVRTGTEVRRVPIQANLASGFQLVMAGREREALARLEQIAKRSLHRSCRSVERLEQSVIELQCSIGVIRRPERWRRARK